MVSLQRHLPAPRRAGCHAGAGLEPGRRPSWPGQTVATLPRPRPACCLLPGHRPTRDREGSWAGPDLLSGPPAGTDSPSPPPLPQQPGPGGLGLSRVGAPGGVGGACASGSVARVGWGAGAGRSWPHSRSITPARRLGVPAGNPWAATGPSFADVGLQMLGAAAMLASCPLRRLRPSRLELGKVKGKDVGPAQSSGPAPA